MIRRLVFSGALAFAASGALANSPVSMGEAMLKGD